MSNSHRWLLFWLLSLIPLALPALAAGPAFIASIDTMKESRDTETRPLSTAAIAQSVNLAAGLNVTHITVDTHWEYPSYMKLWIDAVRAAGKKVWFRCAPNQWENNNGATGLMTPTQYINAMRSFILANPTFFKSGDIFDPCPEPENGKYWVTTYGNGWTYTPAAPNAATNEFNNFIVQSSSVADQAFRQLGITGVNTKIRSTNSWFSMNPSAYYKSTIDYLGVIAFDSYPEGTTTDPATAATARRNELLNVYNVRQVPIVIAEMGYSNHAPVSDSVQAAVIAAELNAISTFTFVAGLNYWVGAGTDNSGGYTHLFSGSSGAWALRPAANHIAAFFDLKTSLPPASPKNLRQR